MHITTTKTRLHSLIAVFAVVSALLVAAASLPSGGDTVAASFAPASAEAAEGGIDGDHAWVKISAGEIAAGAAQAICRQFTGVIGFAICPTIANIAGDIVGGASGVWAEIYNDGHYEYGTW
jgi:hypothetical protein